MTTASEGFPFLIRVAGLPASAAQDLRRVDLYELVDRRLALLEETNAAKSRLADELYELIGSSPQALRRSLLTVRRDCHNSRPLGRHLKKSYWSVIVDGCPAAEEAAGLEERCERARVSLEEAYDRARSESVDSLLRTMEDETLRRGLGLASPDLLRGWHRYSGRLESMAKRKRRRFEESLLRYVTRASVKLSPYSTLTWVVFATAVKDEEISLRWTEGDWKLRSSVRARRYFLQQLVEAWCRIPEVKKRLALVPNGSVEVSRDKLTFLRPPGWRPTEDGTRLEPRSSSLAQIPRSPLWIELLGILEKSLGRSCEQIVEILGSELSLEQQVVETLVEKASALGLVETAPPWPSEQPSLEEALLKAASELGPKTAHRPLAAVVSEEQGFEDAARPEETPAKVEQGLREAWSELSRVSALKAERPWVLRSNEIFEDVLMEPPDDVALDRGVSIAASELRAVSDSLRPWAHIAHLLHPGLDFRLTLGAAIRRVDPSPEPKSLLGVFGSAQEIWRSYRDYLSLSRDPWDSSFNPLELPQLEALATLRGAVARRLSAAFLEADGGRLTSGDLEEMLADVPEVYRSPVGACALVQPLGGEDPAWVVNRVFEGTGRYASRFSHMLEGEALSRFLAGHRRHAAEEIVDPYGTPMDLVWNRNENLMVHPIWAPTALETPGDPSADRSSSEVEWLRAKDLRLRLPKAEDGLPRLEDAKGRNLLPIYLGGASSSFLPSWLRFVSLFGPSEYAQVVAPVPWRQVEGYEGLEMWDRLQVDRLIVRRARWRVPATELTHFAETSSTETYSDLRSWLRKRAIPDQLYLIEEIRFPDGSRRWKPQYLDLSNPLFVELLLRPRDGEELVLEEALPTPDEFPPAFDGAARGQELLVDPLGGIRP